MNGFTRQSDWMKIRNTINKHLQDAAAELGITIPNIKNIAFTADSFRTKIECFAKPDVQNVTEISTETTPANPVNPTETIEQIQWKANAHILPFYGLKVEDFGKEFMAANGERFTLCAIKPRNHKLPIIGKRADGKRFKFHTSVLNVFSNVN